MEQKNGLESINKSVGIKTSFTSSCQLWFFVHFCNLFFKSFGSFFEAFAWYKLPFFLFYHYKNGEPSIWCNETWIISRRITYMPFHLVKFQFIFMCRLFSSIIFNKYPWTLTFVAYFTDANGKIVSENVNFMSNVLSHDSIFAIQCLEYLMKKLTNYSQISFFADCGPHFRNKSLLEYLLVQVPKLYNKKVQLEFFGECHGKNACDVHFSVLSRMLQELDGIMGKNIGHKINIFTYYFTICICEISNNTKTTHHLKFIIVTRSLSLG